MSAVTVSIPVVFVLMAIAMGLTMAANILSSQAYGAKDYTQLKKVVQNSTFLTALATIFCIAIGELFVEHITILMKTPENVMPVAHSYLRIFLLFTPATFGLFLISSLLRGIGDSKTPLYFQGASVVLTAILDPILMLGLLGVPEFGLNGTAYASIISSTGGLIALIIYLRRIKSPVIPDLRSVLFDFDTSKLIARIGGPSMIQHALISISMFVVLRFVNSFGESTSAAYGLALRIDQFAFLPAMTIGMAISSLAGQNIGALKFDRVHETFRWGILMGCGITLICSCFVVGMPNALMKLFISEPNVIEIGATYLRIVGISYVFFAVMFVANGVSNGAGHTFMTSTFTLISLWVVRVPLAWFLSDLLGRPEGIWYAIAISYAIAMLLSLTYYLSGRWKKPVGHKKSLPENPPAADNVT